MTRVEVKPELLQWACERARLDERELTARFPKLSAWQSGEVHPTVRQLETFARATSVPFGYMFLPEAPDEPLPIADFRERSPGPPSGDLLDTIYAAQRRQDWFREYATSERLEPIDWIGRATVHQKPANVAARLRARLDFEPDQRSQHANWEAATLVAVAQARNLTLVTHETPSNSKQRIKVPTACVALGVAYASPFEMLRKEKARFVLGRTR